MSGAAYTFCNFFSQVFHSGVRTVRTRWQRVEQVQVQVREVVVWELLRTLLLKEVGWLQSGKEQGLGEEQRRQERR